ncbi:MAG TPA: hypothetical protein VFZ01_05270 [Geminicoccaceae bacterium]
MANPLISLLLRHGAAGVLAGWISLGGLLWLDVGRLRTLIMTDQGGGVALLMLAAGFAVTFGGAAMGAAIMGLGRPLPPSRPYRRWTTGAGGAPAPAACRRIRQP